MDYKQAFSAFAQGHKQTHRLSHFALGLPALARNIGRARRQCAELPMRASHEAGKGNVVTAFSS